MPATEEWTCSCLRMEVHGFVCPHILAARAQKSTDPNYVLRFTDIDQRWLLPSLSADPMPIIAPPTTDAELAAEYTAEISEALAQYLTQ
ncbi:hypothetical protein IWW55_002184, partial [Coemansia sp. RSA 2706]